MDGPESLDRDVKVQLLPWDLIIQMVPSQELFRKASFSRNTDRRICSTVRFGFRLQDTEKCETLLGTKMKKHNKQSLETSGRRRGGAGTETQCPDCTGWRDITDWWGSGGGGTKEHRRGQAPGPREEKPGWGPLTQGGASGPEPSRGDRMPDDS